MEPKQAKKRNNVMAMKIGAAGAGSFGVGGIVLFGGALITATLVSVFAVKATQKRRRRPETPSPSPAVADEDDNSSLELMMKNRKDRVHVFTKDSSIPPRGDYDETSEMGIDRNEPTSISILDENSEELMKESMEEEVLVIRDDQNGEIFDENRPKSETETGEECEDHGGDTMEVVAAGEEEIQEPSPLPVLGDGSDNHRCGTTEQPPMIIDEPIELVNGEVVEEKEEKLFGNAGDVDGDDVGMYQFGDNQETVAKNDEEVIQEAVGCDAVDEIKVEDNPPSSDVQLLEEEKEQEEEDYIKENREGDERIDLTRPEMRENQLEDEEEEWRQQMQEEVYGKALSVALSDGIEEEVRTMEATSSDQITVEENGLEMHTVDEEKGEEGEIDEDEQQAQPSEVRHENQCGDEPILAENLSLPLLENESLPGYGTVSTAITVDSSSDKGEIIKEVGNRLVEKEETDHNSEIQASEEEEFDDEDVIETAVSMMPNIKHTEEDKPMESDELADAGDGNAIEGKKDYYQKPATGFEQRYISKDLWVVRTWMVLMMVPFWCLCHWYFGIPLIKLGLVGTIMFFCVAIIGFPKPMLLAKK